MPGIFDLSLQLNGFPLKWARLELQKILAVPDSDYEAFVEKRKKDIVDFHLKHNAFYRELASGSAFENWNDLPVMRKQDFQRPLSQRLSECYRESMVFVNKTSGSSGNPMTFAKDKACHALIWANIQRRFGWYGIDFNKSWQARFYGRSLDVMASKKLQFKDYLSKRHRFDIFDLSDDALEKIVAKFRKTRFEYINGYTSNIVLLAKYLRKNDLILKQICPTLNVCITTSEMLFEDDRKLLETQLGVPVANEYGASELEVIAFENPQGEWLVNSETIFVEILDDHDNPLPYGKEGRIVVTSLDNRAHPFIRYDVGDFGILDEKSTAKKPILKKLVGRTSDFAILPSGKKPAGMTFYSLTKKLFEDDGNVKEFVVRQTQSDTFEIDYASDNPLTPQEENRMANIMTDYLEPGLRFVFIRKPMLERTASGKLKQFTSQIQQD
ncbi:phenylacetate--CoA ligase family protein [Flavobacterium sp. MAH-1]|uniref:Phenylacetate--CoA ligase family protein n=1 Tax=Flavobacterium agri TaxID=2743471 RepID=A0A7Y9C6B3_9FLAO|nr:phenylacetate--CoA ligase family protein [Flavobacterium agri]NUY80148.1 phenylacetate--CoA ligase family protein [Flavobacterium agri]NYA70173.1 phenylacetate--CoA ligase family protein [Flavobacterium agri]